MCVHSGDASMVENVLTNQSYQDIQASVLSTDGVENKRSVVLNLQTKYNYISFNTYRESTIR